MRYFGDIKATLYNLVPERKLLIFPIFASGANFNPQNTPCIPAVKICAFLELEKIFKFSFGHYLGKRLKELAVLGNLARNSVFLIV